MIAVAAATSGHTRRRRRQRHQRHNQRSSPSPSTNRHRYTAAMSHLGREGSDRNEIVRNDWVNTDGLALINDCRVLHQYSATYSQHDTILTRQILPPNNANFCFLPYRMDATHWNEGSVEKIISPFGEIDIKTPVVYPTQFVRTLPKEDFVSCGIGCCSFS